MPHDGMSAGTRPASARDTAWYRAVTAAQQGDADAFAALARLSADRLFAVAIRVTRDRHRAEDALQQTLIAAWKGLPRLRNPERFDAWTYRLVVRFAVQEARGGGVQREIYAIPNVVPSLPDESSAIARRDQLERGFARLTPEQRAVTVMHFYVGLSLAEISETLGVLLGTIGSRLHYAKRALRAALEADERGEECDGMTGRDSDRQIDQIIADWLESEPYTTPDAGRSRHRLRVRPPAATIAGRDSARRDVPSTVAEPATGGGPRRTRWPAGADDRRRRSAWRETRAHAGAEQ